MKNAIHKWAFVGDTAISFTTEGPLLDRDWDNFLSDLRNKPVTSYIAANLGTIDVSSVQRKKFVDLSKIKPFPVAVVTDNKIVQGLATAISWLGVNVKGFSWATLPDALKHLRIPASKTNDILHELKLMMQQCNMGAEFSKLVGK